MVYARLTKAGTAEIVEDRKSKVSPEFGAQKWWHLSRNQQTGGMERASASCVMRK